MAAAANARMRARGNFLDATKCGAKMQRICFIMASTHCEKCGAALALKTPVVPGCGAPATNR